MENHFCKYCNRHFRFKDLYDQHIATCEFFHRRQRERDRDIETFEQLPSPQEMYKLVQYLMVQNARLTKDVEKLKQASNRRQKRAILEWLNGDSNPNPPHSFVEWSKTMPVTDEHLQLVFSDTLTDGIKACLKAFLQETATKPICAFSQKPGVFYIYDGPPKCEANEENLAEPTWRLMIGEDYERWMSRVSHRFLQEFMKWQEANRAILYSCEAEKERNIDYMRKISGGGAVQEDRRNTDLRKWLFSKIEQSNRTTIEYE